MSPLFGAHTSSSPWVSIPIYGVANLSLAHTRHPGGALDFAASHPNNANRYTIFLPKVCSDPLTSLFLGPLTQTTATSSLGGELAKPVFPNQLLSQPVCSLSFFFFFRALLRESHVRSSHHLASNHPLASQGSQDKVQFLNPLRRPHTTCPPCFLFSSLSGSLFLLGFPQVTPSPVEPGPVHPFSPSLEVTCPEEAPTTAHPSPEQCPPLAALALVPPHGICYAILQLLGKGMSLPGWWGLRGDLPTL